MCARSHGARCPVSVLHSLLLTCHRFVANRSGWTCLLLLLMPCHVVLWIVDCAQRAVVASSPRIRVSLSRHREGVRVSAAYAAELELLERTHRYDRGRILLRAGRRNHLNRLRPIVETVVVARDFRAPKLALRTIAVGVQQPHHIDRARILDG